MFFGSKNCLENIIPEPNRSHLAIECLSTILTLIESFIGPKGQLTLLSTFRRRHLKVSFTDGETFSTADLTRFEIPDTHLRAIILNLVNFVVSLHYFNCTDSHSLNF